MADLTKFLGSDGALPPADFTVSAPTIAEPLGPAPTPPSESAAPEDYGAPWEKEPKTRFEELYDEVEYTKVRENCPHVCEQKEGRFDPFDKEYLARQLNERTFSTFLNRRILYFDDALKHAIAILAFWEKEDKDADVLRAAHEKRMEQKKLSRKKKEADPPSGPDHVEEARIAWKKAVEGKKVALEKWDAYVAEMHRRYKVARERK